MPNDKIRKQKSLWSSETAKCKNRLKRFMTTSSVEVPPLVGMYWRSDILV
jgi:hypothetical protein